ncbi:MAG: hypothetical protein Q8Q14_00570 [Gemmatimonadales bacterium]|nr:hypothetical protein [Gemmatimonadales bacterium]
MNLDLNTLQAQMVAAHVQGRYLTAVQAGWGSGKTFGLGLIAALAGDQRPGDAGVWVTDTRSRLESVVQPVCDQLLRGFGWTFYADPSKYYWRHPNGFRLWLRMYYRASTRAQENNPLEGVNGSLGLIDEGQALRPEALEALVGRIRTPAGGAPISICVAGLPVAGAWWVKRAEQAGTSGLVLRATSHVNAANLSPDWFKRARSVLSPERYEAMINNRPRPPVGQVLDCWEPSSWPDGNILDGWRPDPARPVRMAIDFGRRSPAVILIQSADINGQQVDVVFAEVAPDECLVPELCRAINAEADRWGVRIEAGAGDPAGKAVNDQTGIDSIRFVGQPRPIGCGVRLRYETDPIKRHIPNGIERLRRRILGPDGVRRVVITRELWDDGERRAGRTLRKAIEGYRYPEKGGDLPLKDDVHDHHCFPAGTLVEAEYGPAAIETLRVGDRVWTRAGLRDVLAAARTGEDAALWEVETESGIRLVGTQDHPVWTAERGRVPLASLTQYDTLTVWRGQAAPKSSFMGSRSGDTLTPPSEAIGSTSDPPGGVVALNTYMLPSGNVTTGDACPPGTSSTTSTAIRSTTTRQTSSACWGLSTRAPTLRSATHARRTAQNGPRTFSESGRSLRSGTEATPGESGTGSTGAEHGPGVNLNDVPVSGAAAASRPSSAAPGRASAPTHASPSGDVTRALMTSSAGASNAVPPSSSTATPGPRVAPERVQGVRRAGRGDVYNLTVDGEHEYFANGVLVSNCDALRYDAIVWHWYGERPADAPSLHLGGAGLKPGVSPTRPTPRRGWAASSRSGP